jgi:hypothetical protein
MKMYILRHANNLTCYSKNIGLLGTKFWSIFHDFKVCKTDFSMLTAPYNFESEKADKGIKMEMTEFQSHSFIKENLVAQKCHVLIPIYLSVLLLRKIIKLICLCALCGSISLCEQNFCSWNETSTPKDHDQQIQKPSILRQMSTQNIKPDHNKPSKNKECQISGKSSDKR